MFDVIFIFLNLTFEKEQGWNIFFLPAPNATLNHIPQIKLPV